MTAKIIILFAAGIAAEIFYVVLAVFFQNMPLYIAMALFLCFTAPMLYFLRDDIKAWLVGTKGTGTTYSIKKGNKNSYYDSGSSYSDSFGGGSSGGGGASGSW